MLWPSTSTRKGRHRAQMASPHAAASHPATCRLLGFRVNRASVIA